MLDKPSLLLAGVLVLSALIFLKALETGNDFSFTISHVLFILPEPSLFSGIVNASSAVDRL